MFYRNLYNNNYQVCEDDEYLNIFVTEHDITVRVLSPNVLEKTLNQHDTVVHKFDDLLSHDDFSFDHLTTDNKKHIFVNDKNDRYVIDYRYTLNIEYVRDWAPYAEIAVCAFFHTKASTSKRFSKYDRLLTFDAIPRMSLNKRSSVISSSGQKMGYFYIHRTETRFTRFMDYIVYKSGLDFLTCPMSLSYNKLLYTNLEFDSEMDWNAADNTNWRTTTFCPRFKFDDSVVEIPADGRLTLEVECYNSAELPIDDRSFQIEPVSGYVPHRRLDIVDGKGKFDVIALGMKPGDQLRVKINDRFYTSRGEKILTVV